MSFEKPQDYVDALKRLEGFPLMGMGVMDGCLSFNSLSSRVSLPLHNKRRDWGYKVGRYGLNNLDVLVSYVKYDDQSRRIRLFDEYGDVIAHVELRNITRKEWLLGELYGQNLHSSMNVDQHKKYALLATGVAFTAEADGLTGVFVHWPSLDSPVSQIIDQGYVVSILTDAGGAVELFFDEEEGETKMARTTDGKLIQRAFDLLDPLVREGWALHTVNYMADRTTLFFDNGVSAYLKRSEYFVSDYNPCVYSTPLASMRRVKKRDGSDAWRLLDGEGHTVLTVELAHPTDPLPAYVAALKEALVGSSVQSVSASDGGLCLHLDDDYDAVTSGALRVRVDSERVPFTVGDVFVNRGGTDLTLCLCAQTESKPVVAFKIDKDALERKEMVFNVI